MDLVLSETPSTKVIDIRNDESGKMHVVWGGDIDALVGKVVLRMQKRKRNDQGTGNKNLGGILTHWMAKYEWTAGRLGFCADLHPSFVRKLMRGERGAGVGTLAALWDCLGDKFLLDWIGEVNDARLFGERD